MSDASGCSGPEDVPCRCERDRALQAQHDTSLPEPEHQGPVVMATNKQQKPGNTESDEAVVSRVRAEYREMPGLKLTTEQASRLWHLEPHACESLLRRLAEERLLRRTRDGAFVRAD